MKRKIILTSEGRSAFGPCEKSDGGSHRTPVHGDIYRITLVEDGVTKFSISIDDDLGLTLNDYDGLGYFISQGHTTYLEPGKKN